MQDRVSLYPGRVKLIPVTGQENTYDMVRADSPTQEGTPLNKDSLLKDATAALFGLGADAVPNDVIALIPGLIAGRAQVSTGSYTGTGTYGSAHPCSLTFDKLPKAIIISNVKESSGYCATGIILPTENTTIGAVHGDINNDSISQRLIVTISGTTVKWYSTYSSSSSNVNAAHQLNASGTYAYIAVL